MTQDQRELSETFTIAQYSALRDELLKRIELQHQLISLNLVALGTLLPLTIQLGSPTLALLYPILSMFLAASWSQSDLRIGQLGKYLRDKIESRFLGKDLGWESSNPTSIIFPFIGSLSMFTARGMFIVTQIFVIVFCWLSFGITTNEHMFLIVIDLLAIVLTILIMWKARAARF